MPKFGDMSLDELDTYGGELRGRLSELSEGERSDERSARAKTLLEEVQVFDAAYTLARAQAMREQEKKGLSPLGALAPVGFGVRDIGGAIVEHQAVREWAERGMTSAPKDVAVIHVDIDGVRATDGSPWTSGQRDTLAEWAASGPNTGATGAANTLLPVGQPIAPTPRQARLTLRDLMPSQATALPVVPYVRELNPTTNESGASSVAEGGTKPNATIAFKGAQANITTIAVGLPISKQLWEDAALVRAYINARLPYMVRFREQGELLSGNGVWPDIEGILTMSDKQSQSAVNTDSAQTIGMAIAKIENVDGSASGVALNPTDAWVMFTKRASDSGVFDAGNPFSMNRVDALTVWGLPTVRSRVHASGTGVVADFQNGGLILDRQQVTVEIFTQHSTFAAENTLYLRCESRLGMAVWRPDYFVSTSLQTS